jgi:hypothetical protein
MWTNDPLADACSAWITGYSAYSEWRSTVHDRPLRFLAPGSNATPEDHDRWTDEVITRINRSGEAMFGGILWNDRRAMRISVVNWRTSQADVDRTIEAARRALAEGPKSTGEHRGTNPSEL